MYGTLTRLALGLLCAAAASCASSAGLNPMPAPQVACIANERSISPDRIEQVLRPNILQVESESSLGSGFILDTNNKDDVLVVTNYHVISEGKAFSVKFVRSDGTKVDVSSVAVVKTSPEHDLALLKTPRMSVYGPGIPMAASFRTGESVTTLGYPVLTGSKMTEPTLSSGQITSTNLSLGDRTFIQTNVPLIPGASGGPVVDSCGALVGVATAHHAQAAHVGLLVPVKHVQALYREYAAPRAAPAREVNEQVTKFLRSIQRNEADRASGYFSREFIVKNVLPELERYLSQIKTKKKLFDEVLAELERRGVDVERLTPEQLAKISQAIGTNLTVEELYAYRSLTDSTEKGLDVYATLQAFYAPFIDGFFGEVSSFQVEEISSEGEQQVAYVAVESAHRRRYYRMHLVNEWGDWRIQSVLTRSEPDTGARADTQRRVEAEVDRGVAEHQNDREWRTVRYKY